MTSVKALSPQHKISYTKTSSNFLESFTEPDNGRGMKEESTRLESFNGWPCTFQSPKNLAKAGFYYTKKEDIVKCAYCQVEIGKWDRQDEPVSEHKKWSPRCSFLRDSPRRSTSGLTNGEDTCGLYGTVIRPNSVPDSDPSTTSMLKKLGIPHNRGPAFPNYVVYESRLKSFDDWPRSMKQKPANLAAAGFFYRGKGDQTMCFHCGVGLKNWEDDDDPWEQHALWSRKCNFLILQKPAEYISDVHERLGHLLLESQESSKNSNGEAAEAAKQKSVAKSAETKSETKSETAPSTATSNKEKEEGSSSDSRTLCKICYSKEIGVMLMPCGHIVVCVDCAPALSTCVVCRKPLTATLKGFLS